MEAHDAPGAQTRQSDCYCQPFDLSRRRGQGRQAPYRPCAAWNVSRQLLDDKKVTYDKNDVPYDQIRRRNRYKTACTKDTTTRGYHGKERSQDCLALLMLVPLDARVDEGHSDQNTTEVSVLGVCLEMPLVRLPAMQDR